MRSVNLLACPPIRADLTFRQAFADAVSLLDEASQQRIGRFYRREDALR